MRLNHRISHRIETTAVWKFTISHAINVTMFLYHCTYTCTSIIKCKNFVWRFHEQIRLLPMSAIVRPPFGALSEGSPSTIVQKSKGMSNSRGDIPYFVQLLYFQSFWKYCIHCALAIIKRNKKGEITIAATFENFKQLFYFYFSLHTSLL